MATQKSETLTGILHKEGLRYTAQREAVWDEIQQNQEHRDVDDIHLSLCMKGIQVSRATVYRTIDVLVKNKLVRKMDVGDGRCRYEPRLDDNHHDHMICTETGDIIEFFDEELELLQEKIARKHGYRVVRHVHQLFVKPIK